MKMFKGTAKKCNYKIGTKLFFFNTVQPISLDNIKPWSVTCPSTLEASQKLEFELNNDVNLKISLCQRDFTKLNVDVIVNSVNKTLMSGGGIDGAIHEAAGPGLLDECQKFNCCETAECKFTLGYKLPAKYVFHTVRRRDKDDYKLNEFYKSCLQKVLAYNVKSIAFCCGVIGIPGFDPREAAKMALATVRLWLESNHFSIDRVIFCTYESADYEICKDLISAVYFPVSKYHLTNICMEENSNTDCVVNAKSVEISNELGQSLPELQIYPNFARNSESKSLAGRSKRISSKVDFNVIGYPSIPLGLINYGENICYFNSVIQVLYSLPVLKRLYYQITTTC